MISRTLPDNVNIVSLEEIHDGRLLMRLEHIFEVDEDFELSKPVSVPLAVSSKLNNYRQIDNRLITGPVSRIQNTIGSRGDSWRQPVEEGFKSPELEAQQYDRAA